MAKTRADLLAEAQRQYSECNGYRLQSLTEFELSTLESVWIKRYRDAKEKLKAEGKPDEEPGADELMALELIAASLVDDDGHKLLTMDEVALLKDSRPWFVRDLYTAARDLNGMDRRRPVTDTAEKKSDETNG